MYALVRESWAGEVRVRVWRDLEVMLVCAARERVERRRREGRGRCSRTRMRMSKLSVTIVCRACWRAGVGESVGGWKRLFPQ